MQEMFLSERGKFLREQAMAFEPAICPQRLCILTEADKKYEKDPVIIKRAKCFYDILDQMDIFILPQELLVGNMASKPRSAPLFPEFSWDWIKREINDFATRKADHFTLTEEDKKLILDTLPYWEGKSTKEKSLAVLPDSVRECHENLVFILTSLASVTGHMIIDNEALLATGLEGVKKICNDELAKLNFSNPEDLDKILYYKAVIISCDAVINFSNRYAALAEKMAAEEADEKRKKELERIAYVCRRVPAYPAEDFYEAAQAVWIVQMVLQIESQGHGVSLGRYDRYMYPYYEKSMAKGDSVQEIFELIEAFYVKLNEVNKVRDGVASLAFGGYPMFQNLIVGGQDKRGRDATNDLTYLCIDAMAAVQLPQPSFSVRVHKRTPREVLSRSMNIVRTGIGMPAYFNDEVLIPTVMDTGASLEEARDYGIVSCVEPQVPGKTEGYDAGGFLNISKVIEITLNNGVDPRTGKKLGLETGRAEDMESYEQFFDAYCQQVEYFAKMQVEGDNVIDAMHARHTPMPFRSIFIQNCLERAKVVEEGGAKYNFTACNPVGLANAADSMMVVKKMVYEDKKLTLAQMRDVLLANYEGYETLRQQFINDVPKYGNDNDEVDYMAEEVAQRFFQAYKKYRNPRGGRFHPGLQSSSTHALFVDAAGPTPDGRVYHDLLADGGVSAAQGKDKNGPTALIKSVAKLDHCSATNGTLLNIKFHPSAIEGEKGKGNMIALLKTYFDMGGHHVQLTCQDSKMLRDAQKHPENYESLVVRVAGFSVLFNAIDKTLQEDIINRTEQML